jgi:hypothetical protein
MTYEDPNTYYIDIYTSLYNIIRGYVTLNCTIWEYICKSTQLEKPYWTKPPGESNMISEAVYESKYLSIYIYSRIALVKC